MSNSDERAAGHLDEIDADCGCAEVWEQLSEHRARNANQSATADD